jgi:1,4-dihydroxy-2-naphthoate polyprenyltransferase
MKQSVAASSTPARPPLWRAWLLAARPATLPAAVVPVLVGTAAALDRHASSYRHAPLWLPFVAALAAAVLIQVGTNFANDAFDHWKSADTEERLGPRRLIQSGIASPGQVFAAALAAFGIAAALGLYLIYLRGWPILVIGGLSILAGLAYTGGPWPFGYHGLGDIVCFIFFGLLAVGGSAYLQIGTMTGLTLAASIPVGLLVTAILVVNNLRDAETDRAAGKRTLAVLLGRRATRLEYALFVVGAYLVPPALWLANAVGPWFWLPWLTIPLGMSTVRTVTRSVEGPTLNRALKRTGQLHLLFGLLFAAALWL